MNNTTHRTIEEGDVLVTDFGATMQLPAFYQVIKRTPKTIKMQLLKAKNVDGDGFMGTCVPTDEIDTKSYKSEMTARVKNSMYKDEETGWNAQSRLFFSIWNGTPASYNHLD